jgi:hypothetical protein
MLLCRFADADNCVKAGAGCRLSGCRDIGIGFAVRRPPFGVTQDHARGAGIDQHFRADFAGMRTIDFGMTALATDRDPAGGHDSRTRNERRWNADHNIRPWRLRGDGGGNGIDFTEIRPEAVHLPIADDQLPHAHPRSAINDPWRSRPR